MNIRKGFSVKRVSVAGFSLIELSLTLLVIASMAVVALTKYTAQKKIEYYETAADDLKAIREAIIKFNTENGHYPCPANPTLSDTDADYGKEKRLATGFCDLTGLQAVDADNELLYSTTFSVTNASDNDVIMGAPPCKDIGLPSDCMITPEGNRYAYAVAYFLTPISYTVTLKTVSANNMVCTKFANTVSPVAVKDVAYYPRVLKEYNTGLSLDANFAILDRRYNTNTDNDMDVNLDSIHFVLIYFGADGIGAYPNIGGTTRVQPTQVSAGTYVGDSAWQNINHNLHTSFDEYFLAPSSPLGVNTAFGDLVVFGRDTAKAYKTCVYCRDCNAGWQNRVVEYDNFTACAELTALCN